MTYVYIVVVILFLLVVCACGTVIGMALYMNYFMKDEEDAMPLIQPNQADDLYMDTDGKFFSNRVIDRE